MENTIYISSAFLRVLVSSIRKLGKENVIQLMSAIWDMIH